MLIDMTGKNEITGVKNILIKEQISSVLKFIRVCFWVFFFLSNLINSNNCKQCATPFQNWVEIRTFWGQ